MQPIDIGDESRSSKVTPAALDARVGAAVIDTLAIALITALLIYVPLRFTGLLTPTLALCGAVLMWTIAPLWLFRQTLGMRVFSIEMVSKTGHSAELTELLFRELVGRGYLPAIYLMSVLVAVIGSLTGRVAAMVMPTGLPFLATLLAFFFLGLSVVGNLVVFIRDDHRTLADLLAKTMVIPQRTVSLPTDEDDRALFFEQRRAKLRGFVITCLITTLVAWAAPWVLTRRPSPKDTSGIEARLAKQKLELRFEQDPTDANAAWELAAVYDSEGEQEKAKAVRDRYETAVAEREVKQEAALKSRLASNAEDRDAMEGLLRFYVERGRPQDAKATLQHWVETHDTLDDHTAYGEWLYDYDFNEEAVAELKKAFAIGADKDPYAQLYLGLAQQELGQKAEAKKALKAALKLDPQLEEAQAALSRLENE